MGDSGKIKKHYHFQYLKYETMMKCSFGPSLDLDRLNILSSGHLTFSNCILILYFGKCFSSNTHSFSEKSIEYLIMLYRGNMRVFYISHYSVTEINPFHVYSVAENTTEINHTGKLVFFIRGGIIVERYIFYICVFFHDIAWKSLCKRLVYVC
jgi:hypothetical protein